MLNEVTDNWRAMEEIARILALFSPQDDDRLVAEKAADSLTLVQPQSIDLGVLLEPFHDLVARVHNFGATSCNFLSCTCPDNIVVFQSLGDGHDSWIDPFSSKTLRLLLQAIGKKPGQHAVRVNLKYQDANRLGQAAMRIAFEVPLSSGFKVYAHPPCVRLKSGENVATVMCTNYSDMYGNVQVTHDRFPVKTLDTVVSLAPRETIRLRYTFRDWTSREKAELPHIRFMNVSDRVERLIPLMRAAPGIERDKRSEDGMSTQATVSLKILRYQTSAERVSNES